jgi:gliding motility-associated-like protein
MKRIFTPLLFLAATLALHNTQAQMVGGDIFMKATHCEFGIDKYGAYGSNSAPPAGYHANTYVGTYSATCLGFVADPDLDGWTVGTPKYFGDYFIPGTPCEGWCIQANGVRNDAYYNNYGFVSDYPTFGATASLTGHNVSYTNTGLQLTACWQGTAYRHLQITQVSTLDTNQMFWVATITLKNLSSTDTFKKIYYMRQLDPDNEVQETGSYTTTNKIVYTGPDSVLVTATGTTYAPRSYLGLGAKTDSGRVFWVNSGLLPSESEGLDKIYNKTATDVTYTGSITSDVGMGLVFHIPDMPPGAVQVFKYTYIVRHQDFDAALAATSVGWSVDDSPVKDSSTIVTPCLTTSDSVTVAINGLGYSSWSWSPTTGLKDTVGDSNVVYVDSIIGTITYTITGTPACGEDKHFYLTVSHKPPPIMPIITGDTFYCQGGTFLPFSGADSNTLWSTTDTGIGSATAPIVNTATPGTYAFYAYDTSSGCRSNRDSIKVTVWPTPAPPILSGDTVYCQYAPFVPFTVVGSGTVWYSSDTGTISVSPTVNTSFPGTYQFFADDTTRGCVSPLDSISVTVHPAPAPPVITADTVYCQDSTFIPILVTGTGVRWYVTDDTTSASSSTTPTVNTKVTGVHTFYATQTVNGCQSPIDSVTITVTPTPPAPVISGDTVYCQFEAYTPVYVDTPAVGVLWFTSSSGSTGSPVAPTVNTSVPGTYTFYANENLLGCQSQLAMVDIVVNPKPAPPVITTADTTYCYGQSFVPFTITGSNIVWYNDSGSAGFTTAPVVNTTAPGLYTYYATQTVLGCVSDSGSITVRVLPLLTAGFDTSIHFGCKEDTVYFTDTARGASSYWWSFGDGVIDTAVSPRHIYTTQGSYTAKLITFSDGGYCQDSAIELLPLIHPIHSGFSVWPDTVCQGVPVVFADSSYGNAYGNAATYQWSFGNGATDTTFTPSYTYSNSGVYHISLVVGNFVPCFDTAYATVVVDSLSPATFNMSDTVLCGSNNFSFSANYNPDGHTGLEWVFGDGDSIANVNPVTHSYSTAGVYLVTAENFNRVCPEVVAVHKVTVLPYPVINLGPDTSICPGGVPISIYDYLNASSANASWLWSTGDTTPGIIVTSPGTYFVTVTVGGCQVSDTVVVNNNCYMDIPNAFTPNGDGVNDYFFPRQFLTRGLYSFSMVIYDRWGQELFSTTSIDGRGWDGKYNGVDQPEGVYVYVINATFIDGQKLYRHGNVTLLK